jgi:hypothetical protein
LFKGQIYPSEDGAGRCAAQLRAVQAERCTHDRVRDIGRVARIVVIGREFRRAQRAADGALRLLALAAITRDQQNVQMLHIEFYRGGHSHTNSWRGAALPTVRGVR